jgi:hypothetical protein
MLTPDNIRLLPQGQFAFETASGREIKGGYEPTEAHPQMLALGTIAKLSNGKSYLIVRTYPVEAKLGIAELEAKGEELHAEAQEKEGLG